MATGETRGRGGSSASARCSITVTGMTMLMIGTICFSWWREGETPPQPNLSAPTTENPEPKIFQTVLKTFSLFCCGVGGLLLFFGLLWSIQASFWVTSPREMYQRSRDLYYSIILESEKKNYRPPRETTSPTSEEEDTHSPLAESSLEFSDEPEEEEDLQCHTPGASLLAMPTPCPSPPPSYESVVLAWEAASGPCALSSQQGGAQNAEKPQTPSGP